MKISAIQPNYFNRISFKADENKQENKENQNFISRMDKNEKIAAGVISAAVVLAGLGYMGYKGKLGKGIQKMLGGAEDAAKNVKEQNVNPKPNKSDVPDSAPNKIEPPIKETAAPVKTEKLEENAINENPVPTANITKNDEVIEVVAEEVVETAAKETDTLINIAGHKFMTLDEFKKLPREESLKRAAQDIEIIDKNSSDYNDFGKKIGTYFKNLGIESENYNKEQADIIDIFCERINSKYVENIKAEGEYDDFRVLYAEVKYKKADIEAAEKIIMDVINESPVDDIKIEAYKILYNVEDVKRLLRRPDTRIDINFDNDLSIKATQTVYTGFDLFNKAVMEDVQAFDRVNEKVHNLYNSLAKKYGDSVTELPEKDNKIFEEALTPFFEYVKYFENMVNELEPVCGSKCESLNIVKNLNDVLSKSPLVQMINEL